MSERVTARPNRASLLGDTKRSHLFLSNSPKSVGSFPLAVCRITRTAGEYRPARYFSFSFCFTRLGLVQPSTCEMPNERFIYRLTRVTPSAVFSDGLR